MGDPTTGDARLSVTLRRSVRGTRLPAVLRACRPTQWLKNLLVLGAPAFAGVLGEPAQVLAVVVAFVAFCLAASGSYLVNDARDVAADRLHPRKRFRPIAAGEVSVRTAYLLGGVLLAASLALAATVGWQLVAVVAGYLAVTTAYSLVLRHLPIIDLVGVAAGFVLRFVAGAVAVQVPISTWFLVVASLGSLFVVAAKREAELRDVGAGSRATLAAYTPEFLRYVRAATTGALLVAYCLWAFDHTGAQRVTFALTVLPVTVAVLRYAMLVDAGSGEVPEQTVLRDRMLLGCGVAYVLLVAIGMYAL